MVEKPKRDFEVRIPARFLKDPAISSDAKALFAVIRSFANGRTGLTFVRPKTLDEILHWGRGRREKALRELRTKGWLEASWKRGLGKWARRIYRVCEPNAVARFQRSGKTAQLISHHSQSQVKSSMTTSLTESQISESRPTLGDLT
jgi:hypothetical protein